MIAPTTRCLLVLTWILFASCEVTTEAVSDYTPRDVVELQKWQVTSAGEVLGSVVKLEIRDPSGPIRFFRITDRDGRWMGHADASGRFSRRVPFERDEQDLGLYAMKRGVALLFEVKAPVQMKAIPLEADWRVDRQ